MSKRHRSLGKPDSTKNQSSKTKRFKARAISGKDALKDLDSRFERARRFGEQLREQRIISQSFLDKEVSI